MDRSLNQATLEYISQQNSITVVQAEDLWKKSLVFNDLQIKKHGTKYMENLMQIMMELQQYRSFIIKRYKN